MEYKEKDTSDTITYPIVIDSKLWVAFKNTVPRNINLNDALIDLIKRSIKKK